MRSHDAAPRAQQDAAAPAVGPDPSLPLAAVDSPSAAAHASLSRRAFMRTTVGSGAGLLAGTAPLLAWVGACHDASSRMMGLPAGPPGPAATGDLVPIGRTSRTPLPTSLRTAPGTVDLGPLGRWSTWLYDGAYPGPELRVREGDAFRLTLANALPEGTSIHWHGVPVLNAMDGVAALTQPAVPPGGTFDYGWAARPPGTYLYHSHVGLQLDRGLVGALVIEETTPHVAYDRDVVVLVDDWLAGPPAMPGSETGGGMMVGGMMGGGMGGMAGMPRYGAHLVNGRPSAAPALLEVARGERVRFRLVNGGAATTFRAAFAGHRLTVTHADGRAVRPVTVDAVVVGPGERYDVVVAMTTVGAWNLAFDGVEDGLAPGRLVVRYRESAAAAPPASALPAGLTSGRVLTLSDLVDAEGWPTPGAPARTFALDLGGGMMGGSGISWTMGGQAYPSADPLLVPRGAWARVALVNRTMARHPMHLHGHFFRVGTAIKDTVLVHPGGRMGNGGRLTFDFLADNPGQWFFHCHNVYHMEAGMARVVRVG